MPAGGRTDGQLRDEVTTSKVLIGLITPNSLASPYVLFDLGARWGAGAVMIPLLAGVRGYQLRKPNAQAHIASDRFSAIRARPETSEMSSKNRVTLGIGFMLVTASVYRSVRLEQQLRVSSGVLLRTYDSVRDSYVPRAVGEMTVSQPPGFQLPIGLMAANLAIQGKRGIVTLSVDDYRSFGVLAYTERRYDDALLYFEQVLNRDPGDYRALTSIGVTYFEKGELSSSQQEKMEWNQKAVEAHQKALGINSQYVVAYSNLGISLYYLGRKDEAVTAELTAIRLDPRFAEAYYNLACIYALQNNREAAMEWLEKAVTAGYDNREEMRTDPTLDNIRDLPRYRELERVLKERKKEK